MREPLRDKEQIKTYAAFSPLHYQLYIINYTLIKLFCCFSLLIPNYFLLLQRDNRIYSEP